MAAEYPKSANGPAMPDVNALSVTDLRAALMAGLADFARAPLYGIGIGAIFALVGVLIVLGLTVWDIPWMIYPFAIGFPLIGPFAAVGLFEVSRRLERGEPLGWPAIFSAIWRQRGRELSWMAFVMLFFFWIWMYQVRLLIALFLGRMSFATLEKFFNIVLYTPEGWLFLAVGHLIGAALALLLFSITVVSIPLLMERNYDFVTAMITSVKTVVASPFVMLGWGVFVTLAIIAASLPLFAGLMVVLPILGHATWHIYKRAVVIRA
ncbi:DUF2189 domain-containing protein [Mesorhizobium sp. Z1-4]|uniref:DUF2189 domain-containing protein n=1 Tax=Mesorhizobium sp. Z1-4 TaxID=2448478 RepID=UPI001FDEE757|nr:DUF2189 domain-containing protein [Mesorhizobium sp. Z1-4]